MIEPHARTARTARTVRRRWCVATVLVMAAVVAACGDNSLARSAGSFEPTRAGTLTVAAAFLPSAGFWEGAAQGDGFAASGGFEWELAVALAHRFGLGGATVVPVDFASLAAGDLGGADLGLSQFTPTAERRKVLDFSTPYLVAPPGVLARPGVEAHDLAALRELRWVVLDGSTLTDVVDDVVRPRSDPLVVGNRAEAFRALDAGSADVVLLDLPVAVAQAAAAPDRFEVLAQLSGSEGLAAALPNGSANVEAVDSAIRAFLADGTIDDLSERWLGTELASGADDIPLIRTQ